MCTKYEEYKKKKKGKNKSFAVIIIVLKKPRYAMSIYIYCVTILGPFMWDLSYYCVY